MCCTTGAQSRHLALLRGVARPTGHSVRAFALRGFYASLFCDAHTGPVIKAGYDAMLQYFASVNGQVADELRRFSRCLPFVSDMDPASEGEADKDAFKRLHSDLFFGEMPDPAALHYRALRLCSQLASALKAAWGDSFPGEVDCLFALERLGMPYRNIRGRHIGEHTEPIDILWPSVEPSTRDGGSANDSGCILCQHSAENLSAYVTNANISPSTTASLRRTAGVAQDALTLGVGDGGNEVGMGKVAHLEGIAQLVPAGAEYAALSENGCYQTCDHLLLSTVSNWGGTAFEMASHVLFPASVDYVSALRKSGTSLAALEEHLLATIVGAGAVDGISAEKKQQVDGMAFHPHHKQLYDLLWTLAGAEVA
mmetsp:Transcript_66314/g.183619  ORF Transcript_66314/g.183619 Transcript_66314/m.183619 type:complete len:368 (+) Transcript_66314:1-1104(+)